MKTVRLFLIWTALILAAGSIHPAISDAAAPTRVAIIPFAINADRDLTFLQDGITDMLASRLADPDQVTIIDRETTNAVVKAGSRLNESSAKTVGKRLNADYVLFGSLTIFGDSVSMDARMIDVSGKRPAETFFNQAAAMSQVIPQVNQFAGQINAAVFGRQPTALAAAAPVAATPPALTTGSAPVRQPPMADTRAHPDTLLKSGQVIPEGQAQSPISGQTAPNTSPNPVFIQTTTGRSDGPTFWKSRNFKLRINGITVGDVNQDGLLETVIVTDNEVQIFQMVQGRMRQLAKIDRGGFVRQLSVDIADINGNGTPEIFVSSMNGQRTVLESVVLEWDGNAFTPIVENNRYFLRVVNHPARGDILLGQRLTDTSGNPFKSEISELEWRGGEYIEASRALGPHKDVNVLGMTLGPLFENGGDGIIAFLDSDKVRVMQIGSGDDEWTSGEPYGGSTLYVAIPQPDIGDIERPIFLPVRILLTDLNQDGKPETLLIRNEEASGRHLGSQRFYTKGDIGAYTWDGIGLTQLWRTPEVGGRIQDIAVADFDNDGQKELLAVIVSKEGAIIGTNPKSALIAYDLNLKQQGSNDQER